MQYKQKEQLLEEFNEIFVGNSVTSYYTHGLINENDAEIALSNGESYHMSATGYDDWGARITALMNFALNETIERVEIKPFDEELYKNNPYQSSWQYHRIEFYGVNDTLVGVIVTQSLADRYEGSYLVINPKVEELSKARELDQEPLDEFMKLVKDTEVKLTIVAGGFYQYAYHIWYFVEAPGGSTYTGNLQLNEGGGFVGSPEIWEMLDEDKFEFFSTSLGGDIEKDRLILKNFADTIYP